MYSNIHAAHNANIIIESRLRNLAQSNAYAISYALPLPLVVSLSVPVFNNMKLFIVLC